MYIVIVVVERCSQSSIEQRFKGIQYLHKAFILNIFNLFHFCASE